MGARLPRLSIPFAQHPLIVDPNERAHGTALDFRKHPTVSHPMRPTGDYGLLGYEWRVIFELKRPEDAALCCGVNRDHLADQCGRMAQVRVRADCLGYSHCLWIVVGMTREQALDPMYPITSAIGRQSIVSTLDAFAERAGINIAWIDGERQVTQFILKTARDFAEANPLLLRDAPAELLALAEQREPAAPGGPTR